MEGLETPGRPLRRSRKRKKTRPGTCRTRPGPASLAGQDDPAGARGPDQGALDGDLRRRRDPRHRRDRIARLAPPRTAACGCRSPTSKNSTTRSKSARRSTSARRRLRGARAANLICDELGRGARRLRPRPARRASVGRAHPARLRRRPRPVRRVGARSGPRARRGPPPRRAPLRAPGSPRGGAAPATVARKLAAIRGLYDFLVRTERVGQNPADLVSSPKREQKLPQVLSGRAGADAARADPGAHAARAARPGDARARLLLRPALRGDRQPRPRRARLRDRAAAGARQGLEGAAAAGRRAGPAGAARATWSAAATRSPPTRASGPCSSPRAAAASPTPTSPAASASGSARRRSPAASRRTRCATASPPTCSKAAPTCARSRSCSATPRSRPPRSTRGSTPPACGRPTLPPIRAPDARNAGQRP